MGTPVPRLTPDTFKAGIAEMCDEAEQMLTLARQAFLQPSARGRQRIAELGQELHRREKRLTDEVSMQLREAPWSLGPVEHLAFFPAALERIGDSVEALLRCEQRLLREGLSYSELAITEIMTLFSKTADLVELIAGVVRTGHPERLNAIRELTEQFEAFADQVGLRHQERLVRGVCMPRASSIFLAMLDSFREIERYVRRMSQELRKALSASS
jgi:Na+/phosphate symporter